MIDALKFVKGSISTKELVPELAHFVINNGVIRGYNGALALGARIDLDLNCNPKAIPFFKAISNCTDAMQMSLTSAGKLSIRSGKFKALIECLDTEVMDIKPEGDEYPIDGDLLIRAFKTIADIIGTDASRPWCEGVLLKDQSLFVTNNIIAIQYWLGFNAPFPINIPKIAIKEVIRIGIPPVRCLVSENSISFLYHDERWIRSQLLDINWPDLAGILDNEFCYVDIDESIFAGIELISPFLDNANNIYFNGNIMSTCEESEFGAEYELETSFEPCVFNSEMLKLLKKVATKIDFSTYPKPCGFIGNNLRGVIIGRKL